MNFNPRFLAASLSLSAGAPTSCCLAGGPVTDLNVMTRRGAFTHRLARGHPGVLPLPRAKGWRMVVALDQLDLRVNGEPRRIFERFDALLCDAEDASVSVAGAGPFFAIEIDAV